MPTAILPPLPVIPNVEVRHIPEFPGYAISDDGRVFSCRNQGTKKRYKDSWKQRRFATVKGGYLNVFLYKEKYEVFIFSVHRLVLTIFVGPCPDGYEACHKDRNPKNNTLNNLRWDTPINNAKDKRLHGTNNKKLSEEQALEILTLHKQGMIHKDIGKRFSICRQTVEHVIHKRTWKHIHHT